MVLRVINKLMHSILQYAFSRGHSLHPIPQSMEYVKKCKVNPSHPFSIQGIQVAALQHNDTPSLNSSIHKTPSRSSSNLWENSNKGSHLYHIYQNFTPTELHVTFNTQGYNAAIPCRDNSMKTQKLGLGFWCGHKGGDGLIAKHLLKESYRNHAEGRCICQEYHAKC